MLFQETCDIFEDDKNCVENKEDTPPKLKQSIKVIAKKEGFKQFDIKVKFIPADGGNYLAKLFEINISEKGVKGIKDINIFVKHIMPDELFTMFSITEAYKKELFAYTELLKIYDKLQIEAKVPSEERFKVVKCYDESSTEFIILENLNKNGFTTPNRLDAISFEFAKLSIEQIAKFHALSFVLQTKQPEYFNKKVKYHKHCFTFNNDWKKFIDNFSRISLEYLDDEEMKKVVEKMIQIAQQKYPDYTLNTDTVCCLCHGDFRPNNVMMKINDDKIKEVILVDYQIINYSSPINDLLFFIFGATDQKFRKDHLEHLKNIYHDTLGTFLKYFDMDVNNYFPRETFDKIYKERLDYGLLTAIWFLPILLADHDDIPDFSKQSPLDVSFKVDKSLKERLEGIIHDYIQWGYL